MISPEFESAVLERNYLRVRIMMKDALLLDTSFAKFNEMLKYSMKLLHGVLVPFDNDYLENNEGKWDVDLMNRELVELVNNFSGERIKHLKKVIPKVIVTEKKKAFRDLQAAAFQVNSIHDEARVNKRWKRSNIDEMEKAAKKILAAIETIRKNT